MPADSTPVHPGLRSGILSMTCGVGWDTPGVYDEPRIEEALAMAQRLYPFGDGSYINEPAEDMPDWKTKFWNDAITYQKLLDIKKQVDPDNYLWCHNCVGSDLGQDYVGTMNSGIPGKPQDKYFQSSLTYDQIKTPDT